MLAVSLLVSLGAETNSWEPHGFVSLRAWDHYLSYRLGTAPTRTPAIWGEAEVWLQRGFYVNSFGSWSVCEDPAQKMGNQIDFVLGKRWTLPQPTRIKLDLSVRYSNIAPVGDWSEADVGYVNLVLSRDFQVTSNQTIRPHVYSEWMGCLRDFGGGTLIEQAGFTYLWRNPLGIRRLTFSDCNSFSYAGAWGTIPEAFFFRADVGLNWQISSKWEMILPGCRFIHGLDGRRKADKSLMAGLKYKF